MSRFLIVAHKTLGGEALRDELARRREAGEVKVHLVVPVDHPMRGWSDGQLDTAAQAVLQAGLTQMKEMGIDATGSVGDANPVYAVEQVFRDDDAFDEIIISTLPHGVSRWLKVDAPSRLAKQYRIPVTHIVAAKDVAAAP
jgi:hypothetical protein